MCALFCNLQQLSVIHAESAVSTDQRTGSLACLSIWDYLKR